MQRSLLGSVGGWYIDLCQFDFYGNVDYVYHGNEFSVTVVLDLVGNIVDGENMYGKTSNIRHTKSRNLNVFRLVLPLSLPNPLKSGVKSRMKM